MSFFGTLTRSWRSVTSQIPLELLSALSKCAYTQGGCEGGTRCMKWCEIRIHGLFSCFWMIFMKFEETIWKLKLLQASSDSCTPALWGTSFDWQLVCKSSFALIFVTLFGSKVIAPMEVVQKHGVAVFSCTLTTLAWTQRSVTLVSMQDSGSD